MNPMEPNLTNTSSNEDDLELARRVLANETKAVESFVMRMRCVGSILRIRNARFGRPLDRAALGDLVQDTLIVIWRRLSSYEGRGPLEAWAYRIASYELLSALRASRRRPVTSSEFDQVYAIAAPAPEPTPDSNSSGNRLMRHLRGREAQIVRLKHFEDLSFEEIAKLLEVAPSTAKTHYYRAVEKLRTILAPLAGEVGT